MKPLVTSLKLAELRVGRLISQQHPQEGHKGPLEACEPED
jgi:hypothetical protein